MIIFMGVAGSGKSLQGKLLADALALPWLSTGEFLRMLITGERRKAMLSGELLDDQEIINLIRKILTVVDSNQEFILDGFPRTLTQADWLLSQAKQGQLHITAVVHLVISEETALKRLLTRGRQDDHNQAISERFQEYHGAIKPIINHFKQANIPIHDIDAEKSVDVIHNEILRTLNSLNDQS